MNVGDDVWGRVAGGGWWGGLYIRVRLSVFLIGNEIIARIPLIIMRIRRGWIGD